MLYRAIKHLAGVARRGSIVRLAHLTDDQRAKLEAVGAIAPIHAPPIIALPGCAEHALALEAAGITDVAQALEADAALLAQILGIDEGTARRYQAALEAFLKID